MEHQQAWQMLDEYRDGELSPAAANEVREHLKACPECSDALSGREYIAAVIKTAVQVRPSEEFVKRVSLLISETGKGYRQPLKWPVPAMALGLAASAFIMVGLFSSTPNEISQPGLISTTFEYEQGGPMPVMERDGVIANHDQVLGSLLEES